MNATHIAIIKTATQEIKFAVVIVEQVDNKIVVQQVNKGKLCGPTFTADSIQAI